MKTLSVSQRSTRVLSAFLGCALLAQATGADAHAAPPMIELQSVAEARRVSVSDVLESPVFQKNRELITALADAQVQSTEAFPAEYREALSQTLRELPFHRRADIELMFLSGLPDTIGLCLEGFPTNNLAIEACATTMIFLSSLTAQMKYRWDVIIKQTRTGKIHELQFGPGVGIRRVEGLCFDACQDASLRADLLVSLEYVFWIARHFGIQAQLDLGLTQHLARLGHQFGNEAFGDPLFPMGKLTLGVSF